MEQVGQLESAISACKPKGFDGVSCLSGDHDMDELRQELDRLLSELAELDRCSAMGDGANLVLMTIARRGTRQQIAEVRRLLAQGGAV